MAKSTTSECDGCHKPRRDVRDMGRDANGDPEAPSLCFLCRKEDERGTRRSSTDLATE